MSKTDIAEHGLDIGFPYEHSSSCYRDEGTCVGRVTRVPSGCRRSSGLEFVIRSSTRNDRPTWTTDPGGERSVDNSPSKEYAGLRTGERVFDTFAPPVDRS
jgi:hypothetical protein